MLFIDVIGPDGSRTVALPSAELTIGSAADNDLRLEHAGVDAWHADVTEREGFPVLVGVGASTVLVDDTVVREATVLTEDNRVGVGPFELRFRRVDLPPDTLRAEQIARVEEEEEEEVPTPLTARAGVDAAKSVASSKLRATDDPVEITFLRSILDDEDPTDARLIYADWLEERGDALRAEYMRLLGCVDRVQAPHLPVKMATWQAHDRLRDIGARISDAWRALVAHRWIRIEKCRRAGNGGGCPDTWGALQRTSMDDVRYCSGCDRNVYYVTDTSMGRTIANTGKPVVVDPCLPRTSLDLETDEDHERYRYVVRGRRPTTLAMPRVEGTGAATHFAESAALEAAAVTAFEHLARDLTSLGAPSSLRRRALEAAIEETAHADAMVRLAGIPVQWPRLLSGYRSRAACAIARENAVEGCVREAFGALVIDWQARHASAPETRQALAAIAADERAHAQLAWDVACWLEPKLTAKQREEVMRARAEAVDDLIAMAGDEPSAEMVAVAGHPTVRESKAMALRTAELVALGEAELSLSSA